MPEVLDPKLYGLHSRTVLMKNRHNEISLIIRRKSRIIMKDSKNILDKMNKIKEQESGAIFVLETNAPVCSKSLSFFKDNNIRVIMIS